MPQKTRKEMEELAHARTALILRRMQEGATRDTIIRDIQQEFGLSHYKAHTLVETTQQTALAIDPSWAAEVMVSVRMGLSSVLRSVGEMYDEAVLKGDVAGQRDALVLKLRALNQLRDLAPRQMEIAAHVRDETEAKRLLFEVHGISDPEVIIEGK